MCDRWRARSKKALPRSAPHALCSSFCPTRSRGYHTKDQPGCEAQPDTFIPHCRGSIEPGTSDNNNNNNNNCLGSPWARKSGNPSRALPRPTHTAEKETQNHKFWEQTTTAVAGSAWELLMPARARGNNNNKKQSKQTNTLRNKQRNKETKKQQQQPLHARVGAFPHVGSTPAARASFPLGGAFFLKDGDTTLSQLSRPMPSGHYIAHM